MLYSKKQTVKHVHVLALVVLRMHQHMAKCRYEIFWGVASGCLSDVVFTLCGEKYFAGLINSVFQS